jgi:type II restriction/modification system DNA methylase subunit YeeA
MNTNQLKRFAQEARRKLLEQVGAKLSFVISTDSVELREKTQQVKQLREELGKTTNEQIIEKVAYTWFNRLMALRFMDANDYQPLGIRVITAKDGYTIPELLDVAKRGNIPEELKLKHQKVYDLLDNRIPSTNSQNEAFKELLIAACNHLHTTFPFLFEKIDDYTELLLPDDLTSDFSIVTDIREGMPVDDCKNVEIIGWLYQFYISEKKDEVFASKAKVKKEDIPAATQLFTPRWIVEYMVQNTVGKLWLQNRPKSRLREHMPYFIESVSLTTVDYLKISSPEEIKLVDPASGSGHILVYSFDLFTKIYEEEGYNISEIPKLIIEKNLNGFEIDERAAQLSGLALMMKAREYQRRVLRKDLQPNVLCFHDLQLNNNEIQETLNSLKMKVSDELMHDLLQMQQATNFGSLIIPNANKDEISNVLEKLNQLTASTDVYQRSKIDALLTAFNQLLILAEKYHCVVTNPPYMGHGNMNRYLSEFVQTYYPDSKADLMACFMESGIAILQEKGYVGMINQHSWMFLSSYNKLRKKLLNNTHIDTLLHLGARTFPEISGEVVQNSSFVIHKCVSNLTGVYIRLVDISSSSEKQKATINCIKDTGNPMRYSVCQNDFFDIPDNPIVYWTQKEFNKSFKKFNPLNSIAFIDGKNVTGNNERFVRFFWELNKHDIGKNLKYIPLAKGGDYRKWYGNTIHVVDWSENAQEIYHKTNSGRIIQKYLWYKDGITFSRMSKIVNSRILDNRGTFDGTTVTFFLKDGHESKLNYILSFFNSKVGDYYIKVLNPTLVFQFIDIKKIPIKIDDFEKVNSIVYDCIDISKFDWDTQELSIDYSYINILKHRLNNDIQQTLDSYIQFWAKNILQLMNNENILDKHFIDLYELHDLKKNEYEWDEISIQQEILKIPTKITSGHNDTSQIIAQSFNKKQILKDFISYYIGCIFGRYSLDKDGFILANQGETLQDYLQKIAKLKNESTFIPDEDNIIPILDDEWFEDDIVGQFNQFLKVTFGEINFNKNIAFIEEQIEKDIRKYFIKDFYPDHIKRYKKRPIYWMFSSPKGSFSVLIYMHRYTPDTVSNILNKYLKEFIGKLKTRKEHLQHIQVSGSPAEKTKAIKESDNIDKILVELQEYERDVLYPLATERIAIDLDDGVLVNYNKFGKAVKEVNGLNDPATKKKVKQFDWIDTTQIK